MFFFEIWWHGWLSKQPAGQQFVFLQCWFDWCYLGAVCTIFISWRASMVERSAALWVPSAIWHGRWCVQCFWVVEFKCLWWDCVQCWRRLTVAVLNVSCATWVSPKHDGLEPEAATWTAVCFAQMIFASATSLWFWCLCMCVWGQLARSNVAHLRAGRAKHVWFWVLRYHHICSCWSQLDENVGVSFEFSSACCKVARELADFRRTGCFQRSQLLWQRSMHLFAGCAPPCLHVWHLILGVKAQGKE